MGTRAVPLPFQFEIILGKGTSPVPRNLIDLPSPCRLILGFDCADRDQWPPEARFIEAAHHGDVRDIKKIAKELDVHGHGILATVASTTYMGMNALHAAGGFGKLPVYQYLVEEVGMEVNKPDTAQDLTPVEHAINYGNLPAVSYLLDHGADLHQQRFSHSSSFSCSPGVL
ncbi:poly [ADP-ribose] polymerase tankyrase-like isoform X2 [Hordeum vulgare subsp. vulgare]|uniref:poly [ADP-ribose] polymerase tankyrase-like isoform X2 n=1 Tax=Hordeum vulgare subsp. vulgare TaxID=112509 RepID=UPI001D1A4573|nr:poly [ADP-ribose] polymerase tankyrase-like isoform X2 [Hordeum vulgare subsp. vulgare]